MSNDLVKRLRGWPSSVDRPARTKQLCNEAAGEIDRLSGTLEYTQSRLQEYKNEDCRAKHVRRDLEQERDHLREYVQHKPECERSRYNIISAENWGVKCTCGLDGRFEK